MLGYRRMLVDDVASIVMNNFERVEAIGALTISTSGAPERGLELRVEARVLGDLDADPAEGVGQGNSLCVEAQCSKLPTVQRSLRRLQPEIVNALG